MPGLLDLQKKIGDRERELSQQPAMPEVSAPKAAGGTTTESILGGVQKKISEIGSFAANPLKDAGFDLDDPKNQRIATETVMTTLGGLAVPEAVIPSLLAKIAARMGAAALGGAAGSLASEGADPSKEPIKTAAETGALMAAGEGALGALAPVGKKVLAPMKNLLEEGGQFAVETARAAGKMVLPAQVTKSRALDLAQNAAEVSLIGGGRVLATKREAEELFSKKIEGILDEFTKQGTKEETGAFLQEAIDRGAKFARKTGAGKFQAVDKIVGSELVFLRPLKEAAEKESAKIAKGLSSASAGTKGIIEDILSKRGFVSFADAHLLRSDLLAVGRQSTEIIPGKAKGAAQHFANILDGLMEDAAKILDPKAAAAWREANEFWRVDVKQFNKTVIKAMATREPEVVFDVAIRKGRPGTIRMVREIVGDEQKWRAVQGQFLEDVLLRSSDELGEMSGKKVLRNLKAFGDDSFTELFPDGAARDQLVNLARALDLSQKVGKETGLKLAVRIGQITIIGGILGGAVDPVKAGLIFLGPDAIAYALTNKTANRWLTTGLKARPGTALAASAVKNLLVSLNKENLLDLNQNPSQQMEDSSKAMYGLRQRQMEINDVLGGQELGR